MDRRDNEQQLFIKLLTSARIRDEISAEMMRDGFLELIAVLEEHQKDVPNAAEVVGGFVADAIHDKCLTSDVYDDIRRIREGDGLSACLLYTSPSPRDSLASRMPSSA